MTTADRLRAVGLRATRARVVVHDALADQAGHRSAEDLVALLAAKDVRLARASVYNVLDVLTASGLVMLADVGPGAALYEVAEEWHHHFVCRNCRRVVDVPCGAGSQPCLDATLPGATIDEAQVIFRGLCAACTTPSDDGARSH